MIVQGKLVFFFHLNQKQLQPFQEDSFSFSLIKLHFVNQDKYIIRFEKKKNEKWKKNQTPKLPFSFLCIIIYITIIFSIPFFCPFFFFLFLFSYTERERKREREREKPNTFLYLSSLVILSANLFQQSHSCITRLAELGEFKN